MYIIKEKKKYTAIETAIAYYTYILHTKVDADSNNIFFVYCENNKYYHVKCDVQTRRYI